MNNKERIRRCFVSQCDFCREGCASYLAFNLDSYGPRGKNRILHAYHDGRLELSDLVNLAFKCTVCGQCSEICPTGDGIYHSIRELRVALARRDLVPSQIKDLGKKIIEKGTPFEKKNLTWAEDRNGKGGIGYFPGCGLSAFNPDLASKNVDVLESLGFGAVPIAKQCCSSPLLRAGLVEEAKKVAEDLYREVKEKKVRTLICSCPGCALTLKEEYPALVDNWKVTVLHVSEVLVKRLRELEGKGKWRGAKVMYHDPCHLARDLDINSGPRRILKSLGYELLEFHRNGRKGLCCGAGGTLALNYPDEANKVAGLKVDMALESNAEILATFCPMCEHFLGMAADGRIAVKDVLELL